jgi:hypothetical protein
MTLDIVSTTFRASDLERIFRERKIPLERFCLTDKAGTLYVAEGASISILVDPITYEPITVTSGFQNYVGSIDRADSLFHEVFLADGGEDGSPIINANGSELVAKPMTIRAWTQALLAVTF